MSNKLESFFKKINDNKSKWTNASSGTEFENKIIQLLRVCGFTQYVKSDDNELDKYINDIKPVIQAKLGDTLLNNTLKSKGTQYTNIFIWQPYGKQDFPDFIILTEYKVYSLEIKYTTDKSLKPMWNSNLPKKDGLYIFGSYGLKDITYFRGEDILPEKERLLLIEIWEKTDKAFEEWEKDFKEKFATNKISNKYGFSPYIRKAYDQSKNVNVKANLNYFTNPDRKNIEEKTIKYIRETDKDKKEEPN